MPAIMIILNIVFITGIVVAIVGLCAWGVISDRPFAAHLNERAAARAQRRPVYERRRLSRGQAGYRGPLRRAADVGA